MQGPSHLLVSWYFAEAADLESPRDRRIVAWAGLAPDVDVIGYIGALAYYRLDQEKAFENVWSVIHHRYTHGLFFVVVVAAFAFALATRERGTAGRLRVCLLAACAAALHCFFDVVAGGPTWPIYPSWPISGAGWSVPWSWTIGEWPNLLILYGSILGGLAYARWAGRSPMECFGDAADRWLVRVVRQEDSGNTPGRRHQRLLIWACVILAAAAILIPVRQVFLGN